MLKIIWLLICCCMVWFAGHLIQQGIWPQFQNWNAAKNWLAVEGTIADLELKQHRSTNTDSDGRRYESITYEVRTRYQYTIDGNDYSSARVSFARSMDSSGGYNTQMHSRLERARKANEIVQIWVNPNNPRDAVIDRSLRLGGYVVKLVFVAFIASIGLINIFFQLKAWQHSARGEVDEASGGSAFGYSILAVVVLFCFMGFYFAVDGVISGDLRGLVGLIFPGFLIPITIEFMRFQRNAKNSKTASLSAPLSGDRLEPSGSRTSVYLCVFWLMITVPLAYIELQSAIEPTIVSYLIYALVGLGVLFLIRIAMSKMAYRFQGDMMLRLNPNPLILGEKFVGYIEFVSSKKLRHAEVNIRCYVTEKHGPGASSSYSQFDRTIEASLLAQSAATKLSFEDQLPADLPASQSSEGLEVKYYLSLRASSGFGTKLRYTFDGVNVVDNASR